MPFGFCFLFSDVFKIFCGRTNKSKIFCWADEVKSKGKINNGVWYEKVKGKCHILISLRSRYKRDQISFPRAIALKWNSFAPPLWRSEPLFLLNLCNLMWLWLRYFEITFLWKPFAGNYDKFLRKLCTPLMDSMLKRSNMDSLIKTIMSFR